MELENQFAESTSVGGQYILTQVGMGQVAFPADFVAGILRVERSQILMLPFYPDVVLGIVHHQGQLVTLATLQHLLEGTPAQSREVFNAVQLSEATRSPGLGLIIDKLLGNCTEDQVSNDSRVSLFQPEILDTALWEPRRWAALTP